MNVGYESHNNTSGERGVGTFKERDGQMHSKDFWWYQNSRTAEGYTDPWNVPRLKKGTIHQVSSVIALTLGPRMGPVITTYRRKMKKPYIANKKGNNDKENYNDKTILAALDCNRSYVSDVLSPGQTESQVDPSFQLGSTCDSVWPGLACTCVDLR